MSDAVPVRTFVASILGGQSVAQSTNITGTIINLTAHEIKMAFGAFCASQVSADPVVYIYRSTNNGGTFDTDEMTSMSITRVASSQVQRSLTLPGGAYAIRFLNSGPNVGSLQMLTQEILTAYHAS